MKAYKMDKKVRAKIDAMTSEEKVKRATKIIKDSDGKCEQSAVLHYLTEHCGLTMTEYLEALNRATDGELLKTALPEYF